MLSLIVGNQQNRLLKLFLKKLDSQNYHVIRKRHYAFLSKNYFAYTKSIVQEANKSVSKWVFFNLKGIHVK